MGVIPRRLVRVVPETTTEQVEEWWEEACKHHPDWDHVTLRDPIDPDLFPITSADWDRCTSGAQLAGLIRLEEIHHRGGIYIDSDVEVFRSFDPLLAAGMFAAWEDPDTIPDAVFGAYPNHPATGVMLAAALDRLRSGDSNWRHGSGAWSTGPGVFTTVLPGRDDVLLLPPGSFYPYHWSRKDEDRGRDHKREQPWCFAAHHWAASWLGGA